jgi:hypothetical protein
MLEKCKTNARLSQIELRFSNNTKNSDFINNITTPSFRLLWKKTKTHKLKRGQRNMLANADCLVRLKNITLSMSLRVVTSDFYWNLNEVRGRLSSLSDKLGMNCDQKKTAQ